MEICGYHYLSVALITQSLRSENNSIFWLMQQIARLACKFGPKEGFDARGRGLECLPKMHNWFVKALSPITFKFMVPFAYISFYKTICTDYVFQSVFFLFL